MGITIHYTGKAKSKAAIDRIAHIATIMACERDWPAATINDPDGEMLRPILDPDAEAGITEYHGPIHMTVVSPGEGCESLRLAFGDDLIMHGFTKTQWGPIETHVRICEILRAIEPFFETLEVTDEGGYWETGDLKDLDAKRQFLHDITAELQAKLEAAKDKHARDHMYDIEGDSDENEPG